MTRKFRVGWVRRIGRNVSDQWAPMTEPLEDDGKVHDELRIRGYWDMVTKLPRRGYSLIILNEGVTPWMAKSAS